MRTTAKHLARTLQADLLLEAWVYAVLKESDDAREEVRLAQASEAVRGAQEEGLFEDFGCQDL
jgi:hypothetical protein